MITDLTKWAVRLRRIRGRGQTISLLPEQGSVLGGTDQGELVRLPHPGREHSASAMVMGSSGSGKTAGVVGALLQEQIHSEFQERKRPAYIWIDPKGDGVKYQLEAIASTQPRVLKRVHYLNPFKGAGVPFNLCFYGRPEVPTDLFAYRLAELVSTITTSVQSQSASTGTGARQIELLSALLEAALCCPQNEASVLLTLDALTQKQGIKKLCFLTSSDRAKQALSAVRISEELRASCSSRLRLCCAATEALSRAVSVPGRCLDMDELLQPGAITLLDLGEPPGGLEALTVLWANLWLRLIVDRLMSRPSPYSGHHVRLICDESQILARTLDSCAEKVLCTGRSRQSSLICITQGTVLLQNNSKTLLGVLLTNTPTKIIGRLSARDAELLAREQAPGPGIDQSLSQVRADFIGSVTNLADREFYYLAPQLRRRFRSAELDMAAWQRVEEEKTDLLNEVRSRHSLKESTQPRATLDDLCASQGCQIRSGKRRRTTPWG